MVLVLSPEAGCTGDETRFQQYRARRRGLLQPDERECEPGGEVPSKGSPAILAGPDRTLRAAAALILAVAIGDEGGDLLMELVRSHGVAVDSVDAGGRFG